MNTLVSILIPCYNVEKYLNQCLDSVINQTYKDLQIVIVDDGSTDKTLEIAQSYANKDSRIELYHQENKGVSAARNELLKHIKGEYFLFVDSDDWMELDMVEVLFNNISDTDSDISVCDSTSSDAIKVNDSSYEVWGQEKVIEEFLKHKIINGALWNKLIKTDDIKDAAFTKAISYGEDALFCWEVINNIQKIVISKRQLYNHRTDVISLSNHSYGDKIKSGHLVWKQISADTTKYWPQFSRIAIANYAISDMWQLYYAAKSNYPYDNDIREFQLNLRSHLPLVARSGLINKKEIAFAFVASYNYNLLKLFV